MAGSSPRQTKIVDTPPSSACESARPDWRPMRKEKRMMTGV